MVGSQLLFEAECLPDLTWLDNAWGDYPYEDLAYEYETQYGQETDESRPGRNLREQPLSTSPIRSFSNSMFKRKRPRYRQLLRYHSLPSKLPPNHAQATPM